MSFYVIKSDWKFRLKAPISAAMCEYAAQPDGPVVELDEPTPEMIAAGAEVICRAFDETIPYGSSYGSHVAVEVFRAMRMQSEKLGAGE